MKQDMMEWQWHQLGGAICKLFALRSSQITTPEPHHSIFTGRMSSRRPTNSVKALKHPVKILK